MRIDNRWSELVQSSVAPQFGLNCQCLLPAFLLMTCLLMTCLCLRRSELLLNCWSFMPEKRPEAKEVVERLAAFPRLISPCLDKPLSVVQLVGEDTHELDLNTGRKHSLSLSGRPPGLFQRATSHELADITESELLMNGNAGGGGGGGGWPVPSSPLRPSPHRSLRDRRLAETTNV